MAIAKRLAADGAKVVISSRKEKNVQNAVNMLTSQGHTATGVVCHVGKASDRENLFKTADNKFGGIDILVSNAAVNPAAGSVLDVGTKTLLIYNMSFITFFIQAFIYAE